MEIRHLRYFKAVAEKLNFTKAAEALHISQPPLTRQIKDLESELGKELFYRNTAKVELTEAGAYFLREAAAILERLDGAKILVSQLDNRSADVFKIGYMSSIPVEIMTQIVSELKFQYPFLKTRLYEIPTIKQVKALEAGKLDIGILRAPVESTRLTWQTVFKDKFSLIHSGTITPDVNALADQDFISFNRTYARYYHAQLLGCCSYLGFEPRITIECNNIQTILSLVQRNLGITILPAIVQHAHSHLNLTFKLLHQLPLSTEIALAYTADKAHPALEKFVLLTKHYLQSAHAPDG